MDLMFSFIFDWRRQRAPMQRRFSASEIARLPFSDVSRVLTSVPSDTMTTEEAGDVILSLDLLVSRCCEALRMDHAESVTGFVHLFKEAARAAPESFARRTTPQQNSPHVIQQLGEIFHLCARKRQFGARAASDAGCLVLSLAGIAFLKSALCAHFMPHLVAMIEGSRASAGNSWMEKRVALGALLELVRGSAQVKESLEAHLGELALALIQTQDFFLQLQCTEAIWRVVRQKPALLESSMFDVIPNHLKAAIRRLPNDHSLVAALVDALETHNGLQQPPTIIAIRLLSVSTASQEICGSTTAYFSGEGVVVLLPDREGENIPVLYRSVRSVRLGRELRLGLRLLEAPRHIAEALDIEGSNDTLFLKLSTTSAQELKQSPIQQWMTEGMRLAVPPPAPKSEPVAETNVAVEQTRKSILEVTFPDRSAYNRPAVAATRQPIMSERSANSMERDRKRAREEVPTSSVHRFSFSDSISVPPAPSSRISTIPNSAPTSGDNVNQMLQTMRQRMVDGLAKRQEHSTSLINETLVNIQQRMDLVREQNRTEREEFEASFRQQLLSLRQAELKLRDKASTRVTQLNAGLQEMEAIGSHVTGQITEIENVLGGTMNRAEALQRQKLQTAKQRVEDELATIEQTMHAVISSADPMEIMNEFLREQGLAQMH